MPQIEDKNVRSIQQDMPQPSSQPKVFISYTHDSPQHKERVLALSERLRTDGIDCVIDQYVSSPPGGWPRWMINSIEEADFIIMICTETYERRVMGREAKGSGLGARWEGKIIIQKLYEAAENNRVIPVCFSGEDRRAIPLFLRDVTYYDLSTGDGYENLARRLTNQPLVSAGKLGATRAWPSRKAHHLTSIAPWNVSFPRNAFFTGREDVLKKLR